MVQLRCHAAPAIAFASLAILAMPAVGTLRAQSASPWEALAFCTERVSVGDHGQQGNGPFGSLNPTSSDDRRLVAFVSSVTNLVTGDTSTSSEAFARDRAAGTIRRVSYSDGSPDGLFLSGDGGAFIYSAERVQASSTGPLLCAT